MTMMLAEENGMYQFDCSKALWVTNEIRDQFRVHQFMGWIRKNPTLNEGQGELCHGWPRSKCTSSPHQNFWFFEMRTKKTP